MDTAELTHKTGEYVVYKKNGIYRISEIRREKICGIQKTYYVLKSVYDSNASVYVPTDCESLVGAMEHVPSRDEIDVFIGKSRDINIEWISETAQRREYFEKLVAENDLAVLIAMYKVLFVKREELLKNKGKTFAHDERMLGIAKKRISEAFAFSLGIDKKDVMDYVGERIGL